MQSRRDTYTAVLFLAALLCAGLYLLAGSLTGVKGFLPATRPGHAQSRTKSVILAQAQAREDPDAVPDVAKPTRESTARKPYVRHRTRILPTAPTRRSTPAPLLQPVAHGHGPSWEERMDALTASIDASEARSIQLLDRDHIFIEFFGGLQRLLGRQVVEDADAQYTVVRLDNGMLTFMDTDHPQPEDMTVRAQEMTRFAKRVLTRFKIPVLYVQAPSKLDVAQLPDGMEDCYDAEADQFLSILKERGMETLDLRPLFRQEVAEHPEKADALFFRTDHHWTPEGAFLGYQALCKKLNRRYRFTIDKSLTDPRSFERYTFQQVFLGSQGRRVGSLYAGYDDLEIWSPKFLTDFRYTVPAAKIDRSGPFPMSLLFPELLTQQDYYQSNPYAVYAGGDHMLSRAVNWKNPEGKRILILRDSFGCALTPFLSLACQELITMDPRQFNGDQDTMMDYIEWLDPDLVIVMNTTGSLRIDKLYPYLPSARSAALAEAEEHAEPQAQRALLP